MSFEAVIVITIFLSCWLAPAIFALINKQWLIAGIAFSAFPLAWLFYSLVPGIGTLLGMALLAIDYWAFNAVEKFRASKNHL